MAGDLEDDVLVMQITDFLMCVCRIPTSVIPVFFFFNDTATTEIYTLSLHDALPISLARSPPAHRARHRRGHRGRDLRDRKSTRLNSSHGYISYAVFCLKKKKQNIQRPHLLLR